MSPAYDYKCKKCKNVFEIVKGMNEVYRGGCPKCKSPKVHRVFGVIPIIWDDNLIPNQGYTAVDKRHSEGIYWDQDPAKLNEARDANKQMREEGFKKAKRMAERDEEYLSRTCKAVSEREAVEILKDPKRKQTVHVVQQTEKGGEKQ